MKISASLLSARDNLETITKELNNLDIDYIHLDIMDGLFVPNTSYTDEEINLIMNITNKKLDVHLMVNDIDKYVNYYLKDNVESITFHYEAMNDINIINKIKNNGIKCGISIKPNTNVEEIYHLLPLIDKVLVMSVEPGKGGQKFIPNSLDKISKLRKKIDSLNLNVLISVDGGINNNSATQCIENGVDILVIGSALTNSENKELFINQIRV
ncbi:MAG: ribulose-phosphate 3-epimerase [Bacilli bacterium]|nr:ribulose-phosphate 3-epimerase [Bacilli bacterium]